MQKHTSENFPSSSRDGQQLLILSAHEVLLEFVDVVETLQGLPAGFEFFITRWRYSLKLCLHSMRSSRPKRFGVPHIWPPC